MIFGHDYDRALWLMLYGDKKNRGVLANFISLLTDEMLECVRSFINNTDSILSHRQIRGENFFFRVEMHDKELTIILDKFNDNEKIDDCERCINYHYELLLSPFTDEKLNRADEEYDASYLGAFSYNIATSYNIEGVIVKDEYNDDVDYMLTRGLLSSSVRVIDPDSDDVINKTRVNIEKIPRKIYKHHLANENRVNRLMRGRKNTRVI